jgi:cytochrome c556
MKRAKTKEEPKPALLTPEERDALQEAYDAQLMLLICQYQKARREGKIERCHAVWQAYRYFKAAEREFVIEQDRLQAKADEAAAAAQRSKGNCGNCGSKRKGVKRSLKNSPEVADLTTT